MGRYALAVCLGLVPLCMAFVDRPVARYVHQQLYVTTLFTWATYVLQPARGVLGIGILVVIMGVARALSGRPLRAWMYVVTGIYQFHPLHGGRGYEAFPSATTARASAILAVVWIRSPRLRLACAIALGIVTSAILIANGHWVADIIGGGVLGTGGGWTAWLLLTTPDAIDPPSQVAA